MLKFFPLTFAVTWVFWALAAAIPRGPLRAIVFLPGVFGPAIVALALTAHAEGRTGMFALLRRIARWRVGLGWYLFAAGYFLAIKLSAAAIHRLARGTWPRFGDESWVVIVLAVATSMWFQAGEEIGWRGYALPRLTASLGLGPASVVLGVIWAAWHLPLFFWPDSDTYHQSFPMYLLAIAALSVAIAWVYRRTSESLLVVMLMHAAVNNTTGVVPSVSSTAANPFSLTGSFVGWVAVGLLWAVAAVLLFRMRGTKTLAPRDPQRNSADT